MRIDVGPPFNGWRQPPRGDRLWRHVDRERPLALRNLTGSGVLALVLTHFARTGINPRFKSEGMLRSKMLLV